MKLAFQIALLLAYTSPTILAAEPFPVFAELVLDPEIGKVCYAVTVADVDGDSRQDIVAVSDSRVYWYQNPTWQRRVIIDHQTPLDNVCIAPHDIDGDGQIDFALGAGWTKIGTIHWLTRKSSLDEPWTVYMIGEEKWTHRMRWADVLGTGTPQLVVSPLNATVGNGVRLTAFSIPEKPAQERWKTTVIDDQLNRMHSHWHLDLNSTKSIDTLTASSEGISLVERKDDGWSRVLLGRGVAADDPSQSGAGEVKTGQLGDGVRYITSVEPMHGHSLVVYLKSDTEKSGWARQVIDSGFQRGHALWTSDVDGDGMDEIVFGHSDTPETFGVIVYDCLDSTGTKWAKHVVDAGGMATEDLIVEDLTGDGRPDIVAGGRATHNLKLYMNRRP